MQGRRGRHDARRPRRALSAGIADELHDRAALRLVRLSLTWVPDWNPANLKAERPYPVVHSGVNRLEASERRSRELSWNSAAGLRKKLMLVPGAAPKCPHIQAATAPCGREQALGAGLSYSRPELPTFLLWMVLIAHVAAASCNAPRVVRLLEERVPRWTDNAI